MTDAEKKWLNRPAPPFELTDAGGDAVAFAAGGRSRPAVLNFWATFCPHCVSELPDFQSLWQAYGQSADFFMINLSGHERENVADARALAADAGYAFPLFFDDALNAARAYSLESLPLTVLVGRDGKIAYICQGPIERATLEAELKQAIDVAARGN